MDRQNNFEGGTPGNTIATTDVGSGDPWDAITRTTSVLQYDGTQKPSGANSMKLTTLGVSTAEPIVKWTGLGSIISNTWFRAYVFFPSLPGTGGNFYLWNCWNTGGGGRTAQIAVALDGSVTFFNAAGAGQPGSAPANTILANTWSRLEWRIFPSATVGEAEIRVFKTADSSIPDFVGLYTNQVLAANVDQSWYGCVDTTAPTNFTANIAYLRLSNSGWIGPAIPGSSIEVGLGR